MFSQPHVFLRGRCLKSDITGKLSGECPGCPLKPRFYTEAVVGRGILPGFAPCLPGVRDPDAPLKATGIPPDKTMVNGSPK